MFTGDIYKPLDVYFCEDTERLDGKEFYPTKVPFDDLDRYEVAYEAAR